MDKKRMRIVTVVGARPQFIKLVKLSREIRKRHKEILVHTGQHYDSNMSDMFFKELKLPVPDYNLGIITDRQGEQSGRMLAGIEKVLLKEKPDLVMVYGDTNSTLAGALAAVKLEIPLAHIEAGLRSYNRTMPEEINRVITDRVSEFLFCPTKTAVNNLKKEGIIKNVFLVGDVMYDALLFCLEEAKSRSRILSKLSLCRHGYFLATIHRAGNVDSKERLIKIISLLGKLNKPVVFPLHPRTRKALRKFKINFKNKGSMIRFIKPVSYFDILVLQLNAAGILTDSGGVQKEAYFLNVPCLTLREETEWLETIRGGGNKVIDINKPDAIKTINRFIRKRPKNNLRLFGNGKASKKISSILNSISI